MPFLAEQFSESICGQALVVDIEGHSGCLLGLNVFLHINTVTGFNLELVKELDPCYISERHRGAALARMGRRQAEDQEVVETLRQRRINPVTGLPEKHNTASDYLTELSMDEDEKEEFINIVESCGTGEDTDLVALAYGGGAGMGRHGGAWRTHARGHGTCIAWGAHTCTYGWA